MKLKKLISYTFVILASFCAFTAEGYFIGDGGAGKRVLVYTSELENGLSDSSDAWIASKVKRDIINDLVTYSNLTVINSDERSTIRKIQKEYESSEYSTDNPVQLGKSVQAKSYITLTTTRLEQKGQDYYGISATIYNIETRQAEGGFTLKPSFSQADFVTKAHGTVSAELLEQMGVKLTSAGKRLICTGSFDETVSGDISDAEENLSAINAELEKLSKKQSELSAQSLTNLEEQAHKTRIETQKALLLQQKKNEEDKIQRMKADEAKKQEEDAINKKRNAEKRDSILSLSSQIEKKAQAIRDKKTEALNAAQRIVIIEGEKLALLENENTIAASIEDYNSKLKAECEAQMKARRERKTPTAEKNPDGTLNERGLMSLENDILEIKAKYEDLEAKNESDIREKTNEAQEQLRKKIAADINKLESKKYTITSIAEQGLYLRIGNYDGNIGKEGWKYGLAFSFDGQTVYETEDLLSYKDLTGKTVPGYPKLGSKNREQNLKLYNQYLDTVENYDSFFRMNVPFVEAVLTYSVRTQSYKNPSSYMLVIEKIEFRNVSTGKKIKTVMPLKHCPYQYTPSVDIDWRTESVQKSDYEEMLKQNRLKKQAELDAQKKEEQKQKKEQKKEEQEQKKEQKKEEQEQKKEQKKKAKSASSKSSKQDPRDTICSLLYEFIPGAVNFYANDKSAYITVGYTATIGLSDNMFIGGNLEAGCGGTAFFSVPQSDDYYYDSSYYETDDTAEPVLTCSGILGASYNIAKYLRASVYGEGGYILNELGGGVGASLELYIPKSFGIMVSSSVLYNDTNKFMLKYSAGIELCF